MIGNPPQPVPGLAASDVQPGGLRGGVGVAGGAARGTLAPPASGWRQRWQGFKSHRFSRKLAGWGRFAWGLYPFTVAGHVLLLASLLAVWREGIDHLDLVLLEGGITLCVITLLMALSVVCVCIYVHYTIRQARTRRPLSLEADIFQWTGFETPFNRWIPWVILDWDWTAPDGRADRLLVTLPREEERLVETVQPSGRAVYRQIVRHISVRDILGLSCVAWDIVETGDVEILPSRGRLDQMSVLSSLFWGDDVSDPRGEPTGDRVDMRQYAHGDSPRMILWKVYARTRKLMVRIPERAITARPRACAYMVGGPATEPVAGLARVVLERSLLGEGWRFGADGSPSYALRLPDALNMLARSGNLPADVAPGSGLAAFLSAALKDGYASLFLFVPSTSGAWIATVQKALASTPLMVSLFVGSDCLVDAPRPEPRWRKLVLQKPPDPGPNATDVSRVAGQFQRQVAEIWRVDRKAGKLFCESGSFSLTGHAANR